MFPDANNVAALLYTFFVALYVDSAEFIQKVCRGSA